MNVYIFSQLEDTFEKYTDFIVTAKSEDDAWKQIKAPFKNEREWWEEFSPNKFVNDRLQYKVVKLDLNVSKVVAHY